MLSNSMRSTSDLLQGSEPTKRVLKIDQTIEGFDLKHLLTKLHDPAAAARKHVEESFLKNFAFHGLDDLKPSFDSPAIAHFNTVDFLRVVDRCTLLGVYIIGIEIFSTKGVALDIEVPEEDSNSWCAAFIHKYQERIDLSI
jgi:hypothetical protein